MSQAQPHSLRHRFVPLLGLLLAVRAFATPALVAFDWFEYTGRDPDFAAPSAVTDYRNPILAGFYPDPSICRVGDDFYLINSSFAYFPGLPIFHSRDLVNWTQLGHVIDRPAQLNYDGLGVSRAIFAPAISHHNGVFYVVCTMVDGGGNFVVTATNPAGPWSDPAWLGFDGIDPSLFFDADGRAWLVNNGGPQAKPLYDGHRAIWLQEFDVATRKLTGPRTVIVNGGVDLAKKPVWVEGPHLYRHGDWYYLCCAEGGTGDNHSQVIFRSRTVTGPFAPWTENPILTQRDLDGAAPGAVTTTGHADLVTGPDGNTWVVFLGCRPYDGKFYNTGRETFLLPVQWTDDGWPRILPPGERVPRTMARPAAALAAPRGPTPLTGNFTWRDDFDGAALDSLWVMLRQPHETWWGETQGRLRLSPRIDALSGGGNPSFLGRRLQHAHFTASTRLQVPVVPGVSAGLVAFQNERHHYFLAVRRDANGVTVFLEQWNESRTEAARATLPADTGEITLRVQGEGRTLTFDYAIAPGEWQALQSNADATVLSTQVAGGFVGATVGIHARIEP